MSLNSGKETLSCRRRVGRRAKPSSRFQLVCVEKTRYMSAGLFWPWVAQPRISAGPEPRGRSKVALVCEARRMKPPVLRFKEVSTGESQNMVS